jgi:hypothetical protein
MLDIGYSGIILRYDLDMEICQAPSGVVLPAPNPRVDYSIRPFRPPVPFFANE